MVRRVVLVLVLLLLGAAGIYALGPSSEQSAAQAAHSGKAESRPQPVRAAPAVAKPMPVQIDTIGRVQPIASVAVRTRIDGQIAEVRASDGQEVEAGDVLFVLDDRQARAQLDQAVLQRDRAQLANAKRELDRLTPLGRKDFVSKQQLDAARTSADAAEATVKGDEATIEDDQVQLSYTVIRAPIDGRLGTIGFKLGSTVRAADATPLVTINQLRPIYVSLSIAEGHLAELQKAMAAGPLPVTAKIPGDPEDPQRGEVAYIDNAIDPASSTLSLKARFPNPHDRLWPGQFVDVVVTVRVEPQAIVVPSEAVQAGQSGSFVFVIRPDATVEARPVTVDRTVGAQTVIAKGLNPGERVVTDGQMRLVPGAKVEVQKPSPAAPREATS